LKRPINGWRGTSPQEGRRAGGKGGRKKGKSSRPAWGSPPVCWLQGPPAACLEPPAGKYGAAGVGDSRNRQTGGLPHAEKPGRRESEACPTRED
jgi:hypothetical protein